jgi:hypothetical protein
MKGESKQQRRQDREEDQLNFALNPETSPPLLLGAEHTVNKLLHPPEAPTGLQETDVRSE